MRYATLPLVLWLAVPAAGQVSFKKTGQHETTISPWDIATGDLNKDQSPDFLVTSSGYKQLALHRGDGKGGLKKPGYFASTKHETRLTLADLDGDRRPDAVTNDRSVLRVHYAHPRGGLVKKQERLPCGSRPTAPVAADMNGDGHLDLVVPCEGDGKVSVIFGKEGRGFERKKLRVKVGKQPKKAAVGDMNGDGKPDIVVVLGKGGRLIVLLADAKKGFRKVGKGTRVGIFSTDLVLGEFTGDGKLDAVVCGLGSRGFRLYPGDGAGGFGQGSAYKTGAHPKHIVQADIDSDGHLDLVVSDYSDEIVVVALGDGKGGFSKGATLKTGSSARAAAVADVNGDGKPDIAVVTGNDKLLVFTQQ